MGLCEIAIDRHGSPKMDNAFGGVPRAQQGDPDIVMACGIGGDNLERPAERGDGLGKSLLHHPRQAGIVVGVEIVRPVRHDFTELGQRFFRFAPPQQRDAQMVARFEIRGIDLHGLLPVGDGLVEFLLDEQCTCEIAVNFAVSAVRFERLPPMRDGLVQPALAGKSDCEIVIGAGVAGVERESTLPLRDRRPRSALFAIAPRRD